MRLERYSILAINNKFEKIKKFKKKERTGLNKDKVLSEMQG
jgi:hypothetical protein